MRFSHFPVIISDEVRSDPIIRREPTVNKLPAGQLDFEQEIGLLS
jgi:hypothetical protein